MKLKLVFLLAISFLLFACGPSKAHIDEMSLSYSLAAPRDKAMMMRAASVESADVVMAMDAGAGDMFLMGSSAGSARSQRMVNYTGNISLESSAPEAVIDTVVQRAVAKGGSVNNRRNGYVSLQIPVAQFKEIFDYILTLGRAINKNLHASDITDAYADNAARLRISESALARLHDLLKVAKSEQEKLALLKEIQRVSEQIEQRKLEEKDLLRKAAFSTINLNVRNEPPKFMPYSTNIKAFEWFKQLPNMHSFGKPIKLKVPQDFIETEDSRKKWSAASALNSEFIAFERKNNPQGTPQFWINAMHTHFKTIFNSEIKEDILRLQSVGSEPVVYYITVLKSSDKKTLKIAVAKFPSLEAEQKNSDAVKAVLKEAK
ncbi:MAG: DUF4349 domain-containing protein [Fibromonadales bacterium]|nr:DUF4349 domain-containing protein [Fibromonadales bacterium]